ncbi:MAG: hypothetical protein IPI91_13315 [Flavobacteriales bacterium]|nr:hypothetical protein [Flavobacteriales bacterium]
MNTNSAGDLAQKVAMTGEARAVHKRWTMTGIRPERIARATYTLTTATYVALQQ